MIIWGYVVMISRRWLSLLLVLLLLLPVAALATSTAVVENVTTGQTYATLAQAVTEAAAGNTLALRSDVSLSAPLTINKSLTLNFGSRTLTLNGCSIQMNEANAALTLQANGGGVKATGSNNPCFNISTGTLNILSGTYQSDVAVIHTDAGKITVSGGSLAGGLGSGDKPRTIYSYGASDIRLENNVTVTNAKDACVALYGGDLTISGNVSLTGTDGVLLFNSKDNDKTSDNVHSSLTMTGGSIVAKGGFALTGNNLKSAQCNATITGGSLTSDATVTAIYWPMEGTLTIGGNATVTGGTAIEAKMGNITIKDQAVITGTGAWNENEPENGGSSPEGSALLLSTQLYGQNKGQFIDSPDLTVQLSGGRLVSGKGNAVTVFNTGKNDKPAAVNVSGAHLEGGRTILKVISPKVVPASSFDSKGNFTTESDETAVRVSGGAVAATQGDGNSVVFYASLGQALENARTHVYVLSDDGLTLKTLSNPDIKLTVAPGVQLRAASGKDGYTLVQTRNANGSVTYALVSSSDVDKLMAPSVTASLSGGKLTATASSTTQGATFTYQWYRDGAPIPGATAATFSPTQKGSYSVEVQASVQHSGSFILSPVGRSAAVAFDPAPAPTATPQPATATPPKTGDSTPLALYALLALLSLAALTALAARRRRHG